METLIEVWSFEFSWSRMARRFSLRSASTDGHVMGSALRKILRPHLAQKEKKIGVEDGKYGSKVQSCAIPTLSDSVFAVDMPSKLHSTQSQRILETSPLPYPTFNIKEAVSRKDKFLKIHNYLVIKAKTRSTFSFLPLPFSFML
jgi:hypothetical protein